MRNFTKSLTAPLARCFWLPVLLFGCYFAYRHMAPFGQQTILTVDLGQQYCDQFSFFKATLTSHPSSFLYSFSQALGGNMVGEWAYYLMSPFNLLFLMATPRMLPSMILLVTLLKVGCAGLSMGYAVRVRRPELQRYLPLFGTAYAMCGWFVANDLNLLWLDSAIVLPLIIAGIEHGIRHQRWSRYGWWLAAAMFCNYYIAYMITLFIVMYFAWRLTFSDTAQRRWRLIRQAICTSLISGAGMAWLLLPTAAQLHTSKTQHNSAWSLNWQPDSWALPLKLIPGSFDFADMQHGLANIFVSSVILIMALGFLLSPHIRRRTRLAAVAILAVLVLAAVWDPFLLVFHGGQYPVWYPGRFSFIVSFWLIWLAAWHWQPTWRPSRRFSYLLLLSCCALSIWAAMTANTHKSLSIAGILIFIGVSGSVILVLHIVPNGRYRRYCLNFCHLVLMTTNLVIALNHFTYLSQNDFQQPTTALTSNDELFRKTKPQRVAQLYQRTRNDPLMHDFYGASNFSSTLPTQTVTLMSNLGQVTGDNVVAYSNGTLISDALLGMQTLCDPQNGANKQRIGFRPDWSQYAISHKDSHQICYNNPHSLPMMYAGPQTARETTTTANHPIGNQNAIWENLTGHKVFTPVNFSNVVGNNVTPPQTITDATLTKTDRNQPGSLDLFFQAQPNKRYYFTVGSQAAISNFDIRINGRIITQVGNYHNAVVLALTGDQTTGEQKITITLKPDQTQLRLDRMVLYACDTTTATQDIARLRATANVPQQDDGNQLRGDVTTTIASPTVVTSVPYDAGWHIAVDGHEVTPQHVNHDFLGCTAVPGKHRITCYYCPPYLPTGLLVSCLALIIIIIVKIKQHVVKKQLKKR